MGRRVKDEGGSEGRPVIERIGVITTRESGPTSLGCLRTRPSEQLAREAEQMTAARCWCGLRRIPLVSPGPGSCRWGVGPTGSREGPWERLERHKPKGLRAVLRGLGSSNAPRLPGAVGFPCYQGAGRLPHRKTAPGPSLMKLFKLLSQGGAVELRAAQQMLMQFARLKSS